MARYELQGIMGVLVPDIEPSTVASRGVSVDALFAPLGTTDLPCAQPPNPADIAPSSDQFLVVLDEDGPRPDPATLGPGITVIQAYDCLPLIEVQGAIEAVTRIEAMPGVARVVPALGCTPQSRGFAIGFNALIRIAKQHRTQSGKGVVGGIAKGSKQGYPVIQRSGESLTVDVDLSLDWPAPPAIVPVLNLSVGPKSASFPFVVNDIVNVATYAAAREMLVVVAAGNCGAGSDGTMSPWATAPWVLSVGATADAEGQVLAPYSSRGRADDPTSGPDVVAWGTIHDPNEHMGTSFAAPRICAMARLVIAALTGLGREVRIAQGAAPHGLPLIGFALIDDFGPDIWQKQLGLVQLPALPVVEVASDRVRRIVDLLGTELDITVTPGLIRDIILSSAAPVPGYGPHEVGAGFVDDKRVIGRLARITGSEIVRWFGANSASVAELDTFTVFGRDELVDLNRLVRATGPVFTCDYRGQRMGLAPVPPEDFGALPLDQRIYGFEVT